MRLKFPPASLLLILVSNMSVRADADAAGTYKMCSANVVANQLLVSAAQRHAAGQEALPPLTDAADGFAWPDTPLGVVADGNGYAFYGSDGGNHARQLFDGHWYGNGKFGSATRTLGTLDDPLGTGPPIDVTIQLHDFRDDQDHPNVYVAPVGSGADPSVLGSHFFVYFTRYPTAGSNSGWAGATVHRCTVDCQ